MTDLVNPITNTQTEIVKGDNYYKDIWFKVVNDLNEHYGEALYKSWFSKISFLGFSVNNITLFAPTNFIRDWIKSNYAVSILKCWQHYDKDIKSLDIITKELSPQERAAIDSSLDKLLLVKEKADESEVASENIFPALDKRFTFDNFVVGTPN